MRLSHKIILIKKEKAKFKAEDNNKKKGMIDIEEDMPNGKTVNYMETKDGKVLITGLFNFFSKLLGFIKKNSSLFAKGGDERKTLKKSVGFVLNSFKSIFSSVKDLHSYNDKALALEEEFAQ